jgi:epoxyqueuosine reductase QueG
MANDLKQRLGDRLKQVGAYDVRVADPNVGFEHSLPGKHPLELWKHCRSVVVFAVACSPKGNNTYIGPYAPWREAERNLGPVPKNIKSTDYAMDRFVRPFIASITLKGMTLLQENGYSFSCATPRLKLAAYEAGLGVYGRSGIILHPVLGSRLRLGGILTDAVLEPDGHLTGFEPCRDCDECIQMCPAKAFDPAKSYPDSFSQQECMTKRAVIEERGLYCHNCNAVCPSGTLKDEDLLRIAEARSFLKRDQA